MPKLYIYADAREATSGILDLIKAENVIVYIRNLSVADYILSERCAVERKSVGDFISSLFDGRLIDQISRLSEVYEKPVLILEGDLSELYGDPYRKRFFFKTLIDIAFDYNTRILFSPDKDLTKDLLISLLQYEIYGKVKHPLAKRKPKKLSKGELQKYILRGLPSVGDKISERLLLKFGSLRKVFAASRTELARTYGVTRRLADQITAILDLPYDIAESDESKQEKLGGR